MSIFDKPVQTKEEIIKREKQALSAFLTSVVFQATSNTVVMFNKFWNNPNATPQEMSAAYGTDAKDLFEKLATWQLALKQIYPDYKMLVVPEKYIYTINQDGTVTITEKTVQQPQE